MPPIPLKVQAQAALDAVTTLYDLEARRAAPTPVERQTLAAFPGFGVLALDLFPHALTGQYKDAGWEALGTQLQTTLTPEDYASAARSTYTAFYTPRLLMRALFLGLKHCGVPDDATVLEPGCGIGRFCGVAPATMSFIGIEQDNLSGRICRQLYPRHDIRVEPIQQSHLDAESVDAVVGNVPFSQEKTAYWGRKLSLHELCIAKSIDALRPGGVLALVVTHYLLDRQQDHFRRALDERAAFLGAIRLPSDAFVVEGTRVVADLIFFLKREAPLTAPHGDKPWLGTYQTRLLGETEDATPLTLNRYFDGHDAAMILGTVSRQERLYGSTDGYSVTSTGVLAEQLAKALTRLPKGVYAVQPGGRTPRPLPTLPTTTLAEGSLLVEGDRICQVQDGQVSPVLRAGAPIRLTGTLGTRVAHLIRLRDQRAQAVQLQRAGAPQAQRQAARRTLQQTYLAFVAAYGPINTVSVSTRADGTTVRRLPNLLGFQDDPDVTLVMALEDYNESTGEARAEAILTQDVVGSEEPITAVDSAAEGLLVVLNQTGQVDVSAIADLYGQPVEVVVDELGDLLYHDPASQTWETADVYLSGHVKRKLEQARVFAHQDPAYQRNVDALEAVQPPDLLPSEIDANLGAPWIPVDLITDFACATFQPQYRSMLRVTHQRALATWGVEAPQSVHASDQARVTYGSQRVSGITLLQQALNLQAPVVHDTITWPDGTEHQVINQAETLVAQEKQAALKAHFKQWLWADGTRSERCVGLYNALRNTHRAREVNGDHLTFPGMTPLITLTTDQKAGVWQMLTMGNTYLGHAVGGGKTYTYLAGCMKMKQAGLIRKPLFVVKNSTLEQVGRMAVKLYPTARYLIAGAEDFTKERRKLMAAKMSSGLWDGIITTHTAFGHLALSVGVQRQALDTLIAEFTALLVDHEREHGRDQHNIRKALERQKSVYQARLHDLLHAIPKDDGLVFDELGIDYLVVDEAHFAKNLETPTKMKYVAGVTSEGSGRAFDLYLKTQYLHAQRPGHGCTFTSATPVTNTMGELYSIQKMLTPDALEESGIGHFDAWAATFGEVVTKMEFGPDGQTLRPRSRFANFTNLPDLQQMLGQFLAYKTAEQLHLPVPPLAGGAAQPVLCPMSPTQRRMQEDLVARYERVRSGQAGRHSGEPVTILGDGKKMAVDARLLEPTADDWPESKLHALCDRVVQHWDDGEADRATQLIFCDIGVKPTAWGFCFYDQVIEGLVARGKPRHQIARIDQAKTDQARLRLCTQVQHGEVRVLLGSTEKLGTGVNVQERLVAIHHVDVPYRPSDIEQRHGRMLRQGNLHRDWGKPVYIYVYGTEGSVEAVVWQALEGKAHFLHQFLSGAVTARTAADVGEEELTYAQLKALVSGHPAMRVLAETSAEVRRVTILANHHKDQVFQARRRLKSLPDDVARQTRYLHQLQADLAALARWQHAGVLTLDGQYAPSAVFPLTPAEARRLLDPYVEPYLGLKVSTTVALGTYKGLRFGLAVSGLFGAEVWLEGQATRRVALGRRTHPGAGVLSALRDLEADVPVRVAQAQHLLAQVEQEGRNAEAQTALPFTLKAYLKDLTWLRDALEDTMAEGGDVGQQPELVQQIADLRATQQHHAESALRETTARVSVAEAIVTTITRQQQAQEDLAAAD